MTVVKICGIRRSIDAEAAAEAGADMLGFVFAPSRRQIEPGAAKEIIDAVRAPHPPTPSPSGGEGEYRGSGPGDRHDHRGRRSVKLADKQGTLLPSPLDGYPAGKAGLGAGSGVRGPLMVGVFVNAEPEEMMRIARLCDLDAVQLSGDEPDEVVEAVDLPTIKAIHVRDDEPAEALAERVGRCPADLVLLDTARVGSYGGTGETFRWERLPVLQRPILLAGGLNSENVVTAIETIRPWGVDVSSGVEMNGEKDRDRITGFVRAARG